MRSVISFVAAFLLMLVQTCNAQNLVGQSAPAREGHEASSALIGTATPELVRPDSTQQLLSNLKTLIATNALVRASSFNEQALTQILGGEEFYWIANRPTMKMANVKHFPSTLSEAAADPRYSIFVLYASNAVGGGGPEGQIIVPQLDPSIRIGALIRLFGNDYKVSDAHAGERIHPTLLEPSTVPEGNKVYSYEFTSAGVGTYLAIALSGDGRVDQLSFTQIVIAQPTNPPKNCIPTQGRS